MIYPQKMKEKTIQCIITKPIKTLLLTLCCVAAMCIKAQSPLYQFSQSMGTYSAITGGTVYSSGGSMDDAVFNFSLPFTYTFNATPYTSGYASENGYISFGTTVPNAGCRRVISNVQTGLEAAAPFAHDLGGESSSEMRGELLGAAPNRTFVVQWSNIVEYLASSASFNFQVRINEGGGIAANQKVEFVYGNCTNAWADLIPQVGLRGVNNTQFINRTSSGTSWATNTAGTGNNDGCFFSSTNASIAPVNGLKFIWTRIFPVVTYTGSLSPFTTCSGTASATQTLAVSGSSLAANINITAPSGMEVSSTSSSSGFGSSVSLATSNYTVAPTTLYFRINSSATGTLSGNVTISNFGTTTQSLAVNGTANTLPVIAVNSGSICAGQTFTISPSGANTYTVQGGSNTVSPAANTSYTVLGTSAAGCVSQTAATSSVTVNANPTVTVNSGAICAGQTFTISPSGANTYTVQGGSNTVSPVANTSYTVRGTSSAGCVSQTSATSSVTVNANPTVTVNSGAICASQVFTISPSGANTYTVQGGSNTVSPVANTSYTVRGTSAAGCVSQTAATSSVTVNALPIITVNSGAICAGQVFTISPSGANTYTVQGGSNTVSPITNTSYTVAGTNIAGCVSQTAATSSVTVNANPTVTVNSGAICAGQIFTISPSGANTYTVQGGSNTVSPVANTSYTVLGTSAAGCVSQTAAVSNVTVNANPVLTASSSKTLMCVGETATLSASGATTYTWSTSSLSVNVVVSPTITSTYTVTGTDNNGCKGIAVITQSVDACTGLADNHRGEQVLNIYPNPNTGEFMIEVQSAARMIITDMMGKIVVEGSLEAGENLINLKAYNNGVYIVQLTGSSFNSTMRIVKD
jgi:hypothetical protein